MKRSTSRQKGLTTPRAGGVVSSASAIGADYFRYHEDRHALIGAKSGETHRLGDRVTVRLVEAAPVAGALRFELLSEGRHNVAGKRRIRREHSGGAPSANRPRRARMGRQ